MTARSSAVAMLKPVAIGIAALTVVIATPVAGLLGVAAWQQFEPTSLRVVVHELSILTRADGDRSVMDNVMAALGPDVSRPG